MNKIEGGVSLKNRHRSKTSDMVNQSLVLNAFEQTPLALIAISVNSFFLAFVLWGIIDSFNLALWLFGQMIVITVRLYAFIQYKVHHVSIEQLNGLFIFGVLLSALVWGSSSFVLFPPDNLAYQVFLAFILAGMSAGAVTTLSPIPYIAYAFLTIVLFPLLTILLIEGGEIRNGMALMVLLFWIMLIAITRRFYENLYKTKESRLELEDLTRELKISEEHFETIFNEAPVGIFYYDNQSIVIECNLEILKVLQINRSVFIGMNLNLLPDRRVIPAIKSVFEGKNGFYEGPYHTMVKDLDLYVQLKTSPIYDVNHQIIGGIGIANDMTDRVHSENIIRHQAHYDALTDIPNRLLLMDRIDQAIIRYKRHHDHAALLFIDVDRFKTINDSLGHHIGDELLKEMANRIVSVIREEDTVSRIGGDEFVVLVSDLGSDMQHATSKVERIAEKIHSIIAKPFELIEGHVLNITSSIGIAFINNDNEGANDLLKHADAAMYQAKKEGRNTTRFYQELMDEWIKKRLFLEEALRHAIENQELELYYQPVIEISSKKIIGAEALLRWNHPTLGIIMPDEMISIAEESGLIIPIGKWVLEQACIQCKEWFEKHPNGKQLTKIAVNVSALQFKQDNFVTIVKETLDKTGIDPSLLELELTESIIVDALEPILEKMKEIRALGIRLSIDDFGTGYSSLAYLKKMPFDTLKIDRTFIRDLTVNEDDAAMVKTMIMMANIFKMNLIAEGVELEEQYTFLAKNGCQYFQGYLCSKPIQANEFESVLYRDLQKCIRDD